MKMKTERDFRAEELYDIIELKYAEQFTQWAKALSEYTLDNDDGLEQSASIATKIAYAKCLLDAIHEMDMSLEEINQIFQLLDNGHSFSSFVDLFISFGIELNTKSIGKCFLLVLHTIMWYKLK